ncbi:MAG TPA: BlaI/MecI/CopY family transcriptional regulator [Verrucomicrobiae bacterium]|jgi:BlaI family penicillinase repressor
MKTEQKKGNAGGAVPRISDAEWVVMKVLWQLESATAKVVVERLRDSTDWKPKTIHTLLTRLVKKGALGSEKQGREYVFQPRVTEQECRMAASESFLGRVFDGEIAPFLACFLKRESLTRNEIEELQEILNKHQS